MCFIDCPRVFGFSGYLQSKEAVQEAVEVGTTQQGAPGPPGAPRWAVVPFDPLLRYFFGPMCVFYSRKNLQKVSLCLDFVWY